VSHKLPLTIDPTPVRDILLVARYEVLRAPDRFEATSLPGHLIHLVVQGCAQQDCNGRQYLLKEGNLLWYHDDELVRGTVLQAPWAIYSVNFNAPELLPPPFESRLQPGRAGLRPLFEELHVLWKDEQLPRLVRKYRAHALLLQMLSALVEQGQEPQRVDPHVKLWWEIETELRKDLCQPVCLRRLSELSKSSAATISRSCRAAVGVSPLRRIKQVRLSLARGLVLRSTLSMKEIAVRIGYDRVHEFSRDYHKYFGKPPSTDREISEE
jgi:AraC-like DNA-binding protein